MSRVFHIQKDNQEFGPMDKNQVREGIRRGTILPDNLVWTEGMETWLKVRKVSLFKDLCATETMQIPRQPSRSMPPLPFSEPPADTPKQLHREVKKETRRPEETHPKQQPTENRRPRRKETGRPSIGRAVVLAVSCVTAAALLVAGGLMLARGIPGSQPANPYQDFSASQARDRKAEWDRAGASGRAIQDLSDKMIDDLETVFNANRTSKGLGKLPVKLDSPMKAYRTLTKGNRPRALVRDDAQAFHAGMVTRGNQYFSGRQPPPLSVDPLIIGEMETGPAEKARYNALPHGIFKAANIAGLPVENLDLAPSIIPETEGQGDVDHVLIVPFGLRSVQSVSPGIQDYALEALDRDGKSIKQGRIHSALPLEHGKNVEVKGYLAFAQAVDIDRIARLVLVKKPDELFLDFQRRLKKALENGETEELSILAQTMKAGWSRTFLEMCDKSLGNAKPTTRSGITRALRAVLEQNIDQEAFALLEKLIMDADTAVARDAIRVGDGLKPCPQPIIQRVMRAAATRKDDARKDAMAFIRGLDPAVPENIEMFIRESANTDHGIRSIAASFLSRANLEGGRNLELGARFVADDHEEVVMAGARMIAKQAKADRAKVLALSLPLLGNRFDSCRALVEATFREMEPFGQTDLPILVAGLEERAPETKCRVLEIFTGMKADASMVAGDVAKALADEAESVRARAASSLSSIQADLRTVQKPLFEAATREKVPAVRVEAIRTLSLIGRDARVVGLLFDGLGDAEPKIVKASQDGFANLKPPLGKEDLPVIGSRLASQVLPARRQAYESLQATGPAGVVHAREVAAGLVDLDPSVVLSSLKCAQHYPDKIQDGCGTVVKILDQRYVEAKDDRIAIACLEYLSSFGPKAAGAIPTLRRIAKDGQHTTRTVPMLRLVQSIGPESHPLVPDLTRLVSKPQVQGFVNAQAAALQLKQIILQTNNNLALRDALAATGENGAKALAQNLLNPDPTVQSFSLMCLENMGKDAQPVMGQIFRLTVRQNAKNPAVWFIAQLAYGKLEGQRVAVNKR